MAADVASTAADEATGGIGRIGQRWLDPMSKARGLRQRLAQNLDTRGLPVRHTARPGAAQLMGADWTIPFDDILCLRFRVCIVCAQPADRVELREGQAGFVMAMGLCARCVASDRTEARRTALVEAHAQRARAG